MIRRTPLSHRTALLFPYPTLFRSHFRLGAARLALALLHRRDDALVVGDRQPDLVGDLRDVGADRLRLVLVLAGEVLPAPAVEPRQVGQPARIELVAVIAGDELGALDARLLRQAQELDRKSVV